MNEDVDFVPTGYELVVGLEIHVQLNTHTKLFSGDGAQSGAEANTQISTVTLGLPGVLPVLNKAVIEKAVRMGLALNCSINQQNYFDRKSYFYADLPKGYQITQDNLPICVDGYVELKCSDNSLSRIRINRIHMEEDAGKSLHDQDLEFSLIDLNRAGVPLLEIVTEPDIRTADEAALIFSEVRKLVRHFNVGDGNMEAGNLRCDANISIRKKGATSFGTRCEVKNLNSIKNLRRAIEFEFERQVALVNAGGSVVQSTLNFNAETGETSPMRSKEEANDYRYFPDPDILPVYISDQWLEEIKNEMPKRPSEILGDMVAKYGIPRKDAEIILSDAFMYEYFMEALPIAEQPKHLANLVVGPVRALLNESKIEIHDWNISANQLAKISNLLEQRKINQVAVFQSLIPLISSSDLEPEEIAAKHKLLISNNESELDELIQVVLQKYPKEVETFKKGKKGVLGLFVGEIMKQTSGKFDPILINSKFIKAIENEKN